MKGKFLLRENPEEYFELPEYNIAVEKHIFWQDRYQVVALMEDFLNRKIDGKEFCDEVYGLRRKLIDSCKKFNIDLGSERLKDFQLDLRSTGFGGFLTSLYSECEYFDEDYENDKFYTSIKNGFLKFQKVLDEE